MNHDPDITVSEVAHPPETQTTQLHSITKRAD